MEHSNKGFTLIELLVAIGIIATLTAILLPNFMGARERAKDAQKIQDLNSIKSALRLYYNDHQAYPTGTEERLGSSFSEYLPTVENIGFSYSYTQTNGGDGFYITAPLEANRGDDGNNSQLKCGLTPTPGLFAVCAN
ncbi:MAG TPA: type II secretion system protein [Candidatus Woesebacteria bacterium]|nr:type II secretion system protein [Candidatus Woesebacteria bacterium]